ncbi:MAG: hypothetical protein IKS34_04450, partial [Clostridia bacterium]|nr:hypothetical protein [Clostridia bacterium]
LSAPLRGAAFVFALRKIMIPCPEEKRKEISCGGREERGMDPQFASDRHFFDDLKAQVCEMVLTNLQMRSITSSLRAMRL